MIDNEYIISPKDLCTINILDQVISHGATILKIEGRGKGPEYVYTVTKAYRRAIEEIRAGTYTQEKAELWKTELERFITAAFGKDII